MAFVRGEPTERNYWSGRVRFGGTVRSGNTDQLAEWVTDQSCAELGYAEDCDVGFVSNASCDMWVLGSGAKKAGTITAAMATWR